MMQTDPQGAQIQIDAMIANRVSVLTPRTIKLRERQIKILLVALKQRELDLKAMDLQRKATEGMMNFDLKKIKSKKN